jgi:hypothetical protein
MYLRRFQASAVSLKEFPSMQIHESLRHLTSGGIVTAKKQQSGFWHDTPPVLHGTHSGKKMRVDC